MLVSTQENDKNTLYSLDEQNISRYTYGFYVSIALIQIYVDCTMHHSKWLCLLQSLELAQLLLHNVMDFLASLVSIRYNLIISMLCFRLTDRDSSQLEELIYRLRNFHHNTSQIVSLHVITQFIYKISQIYIDK